MHLVFETIWEYRFIYRDLNNILNRGKKPRTHFRRILEHKMSTATTIRQGLVEAGVMFELPEYRHRHRHAKL